MEQWANATDQELDLVLPGFRFHPTDEELVGFYLRRKVVGRPIGLDIIKQIDIYKYDPWDLPKITVGVEKEWFFFCHRARKYRNSVRPNRVTGSGFWKATGIDKQVLSTGAGRDTCIGLKKSLVYYRGSAGKGVKTDWMMHEFRLPPVNEATGTYDDAEVWTICRIFKRNNSGRKSAQHLQYGISMERSSVDTKELIMNHDGRAMPTCTSREDDEHGSCIKRTAEVSNPSGWEDDDHGCMKQANPSGWEVIRPSLASSSGSCSPTSVTDDIIATVDNDVNWDNLGGLMDIMLEPIPSDEHIYLQTSAIAPEELLVDEEVKGHTYPYAYA